MNPKILIFDDSTSFVDAETEAAIQRALDRLLEGRTTFIITHRLSTIKKVDRIVILDKGRIAEVGTHEELLRKKGIYARIYETQFAEVEKPPHDRGSSWRQLGWAIITVHSTNSEEEEKRKIADIIIFRRLLQYLKTRTSTIAVILIVLIISVR